MPFCGETDAQLLLQLIELEELAPIGEAVRVWVKCKTLTQNQQPAEDHCPAGCFFSEEFRTSEARLMDGYEMCLPGDTVKLEVALEKSVAIEKGSRFAIREGGRTVGSGIVTEVA